MQVGVQSTGHGLVGDLAGTRGDLDPPAGRPFTSTRTAYGAGRRRRAVAVVIDATAPHGLAPLNGSSWNVGVSATPWAAVWVRWLDSSASPPTTCGR